MVGDRPYNAERANWFNTHIRTIHETNRAFDPTHFVLNFPCGTDGWSKGMRKRPLGLCPIVNGRPFSYWNPYACVWEDVIGTRCTVLPSAPPRNEHQVSTRSFYAYWYVPRYLCRLSLVRAHQSITHTRRLHPRKVCTDVETLFFGDRLFQEYFVMAHAKVRHAVREHYRALVQFFTSSSHG